MGRRRLRPALDIVSDIGALGFDLQFYDDKQIAVAVDLLRTVNPELFSFLVRALGGSQAADAVDPQVSNTGTPSTRDV